MLAGRQHLHPAVHRVHDAACAQPASSWSLQAMAAVAKVTPRHIARLFTAHAEVSPRRYVGGRAGGNGRPVDARPCQGRKQALANAGVQGDRQWRRMRDLSQSGQMGQVGQVGAEPASALSHVEEIDTGLGR